MKLGSKSYNLQRYLPRNPDNKRGLERMHGAHLRITSDDKKEQFQKILSQKEQFKKIFLQKEQFKKIV